MNNSILKKTLKQTVSCIGRGLVRRKYLRTVLWILLLICVVVVIRLRVNSSFLWSNVTHFTNQRSDQEILLPVTSRNLSSDVTSRNLSSDVTSTRIVWSNVTHFQRQLSDQETSLALRTIQEFVTLLRNHSLPYFICAGTLIGSYRHHGFIPWDDDIDVYVAKEKKHLLKTLQQTLNDTGFVLDDSQGSRWKFYHTSGAPIRGQWRFPFLDISFYKQNTTHFWDSDTGNYPGWQFSLEDVFPLSIRPFQGLLLPSPRKPLKMLEKTYPGCMSTCSTPTYNHRYEVLNRKTWTVPCHALASRFPFVQREISMQDGCNETLVLNGSVISWEWITLLEEKC